MKQIMRNIEVRQCVIAFGLLVVCMVFPNILLAQGMSGSKEGFSAKQYDKDNNIIMESEFNYFDIGFSSRPVGRVNR